ncbi:ABC transporter ATP-binding protein [Saccharococcus caldoxylosilyticus]|jgi:ABC-2 type transport system ATP-binding protein|uniref:Putative ABC transporter ATP-binding protein n=1 Tax=Parageobacillus caldoxylosilyticus NBRC 107762 TaxID=1220594 RepID=A0A023DFC7_9BACL|nr:ABC transporter ATP-binding protein [Parageobacillus caldoxylosilyticus]MBB3851483.1 ABC-2 type transport system ATP-binding protein [Parageobacillus caldoxylosilyticus]BDG35688.1 ABC transporter ATP-binding protein YtrB [Parageobacillus caldoxylosilyticus]BDG39467.1 ABC transporter ATP-binding protein YtrB [Parageobacillus caldoxylosilyticus]GAJ39999.1 putative ABC transporter ATP-binding protein [Parageobacillus caldoxylosilyticus NBRC 107762]
MIHLTNVTKTFDRFQAIRGVSMTVQKGRIYGLLGSNGAGKTTLLKMMAGIIRPDHGTVLIDGEEVWENPKIKRRIMFLPDHVYFFPQTTIEQMAAFYESIYPSFHRERFTRLQEIFLLDPRKKIHQFSKGMQRQAAFWLAFSTMPDVLVMDEPLDGLDAVVRQKVKNIIVQEVAEREMTVVISSHNLREMEDLCDCIGILHEGEMLFEKELDAMKTDIHKIQVAFRNGIPKQFAEQLNIVYKEQRGSVLLLIVRGEKQEIVSYIKPFQPLIFDILPLTLEEIFIYEMGDVGYAIENIIV